VGTIVDEIVFTGRIDEYFNYECGKLEYNTGCNEDIDVSYPVNYERYTSLYEHYKTLANAIDNVYFYFYFYFGGSSLSTNTMTPHPQ
jgi:UDP-galactopyranose mutase